MPKYYYHPLGDYAKNYVDGTATFSQRPHSRDTHGWSKIDWGVEEGLPVYSMTDGEISSVNCRNADGQEGYVIVVKSDRKDGTGKEIYINYLELNGLSKSIAPLAGISAGPRSYSHQHFTKTPSYHVSMGEHIGYTNGIYTGSAIHTDFTYGDRYTGQISTSDFNSSTTIPHLTSPTQLVSNFKTDGKIVYFNGEIMGTSNSKVPTSWGGDTIYPVYSTVSYLTLLQKPTLLANSFNISPSSPGDSVSIIGKEGVRFRENMNQQAVNFYLTGTMGNNWMGNYPNTIEELNQASLIRYATAIAQGELNFEYFSGISYGKVFRAKMIGETWHSGNTGKEWFEQLGEKQFANKSKWLNKTFSTQNDLVFAQGLYNNIKYPDIYGAEKFKGKQQFFDLIVYACQQIPIYNLNPKSYAPWAFVVDYDVNNDINYGERGGGAGHYLLYRQKKGDMTGFNTKVQT